MAPASFSAEGLDSAVLPPEASSDAAESFSAMARKPSCSFCLASSLDSSSDSGSSSGGSSGAFCATSDVAEMLFFTDAFMAITRTSPPAFTVPSTAADVTDFCSDSAPTTPAVPPP
jgi:hypothetical protein